MKRIVLGIQYDGQPWSGWQTQPGGDAVQDALESALKKFTLEKIKTTCAGRTDAGVHALEQVVHFDTLCARKVASWVSGLNAYLPHSIVVRWAYDAPKIYEDSFHARFSALSRTYYYVIYNHPVRAPLLSGKVGWVFRPLDIAKMRLTTNALIGVHDFSAFRSSECQARSPIRNMNAVVLERHGDFIIFKFKANAFLHHMIRNIVGSLIYVGMGKKEPEWIQEILVSKNRKLAAPTFQSSGLYLAKVEYSPEWALPQESSVLLF